MTTTVTMLQTRRGEDGNSWLVGQSYSASDAFAAMLITANYATGTLPTDQDLVPIFGQTNSAGQVTSLVSGDGSVLIPVVGGLSTEVTAAAASANVTKLQAALTAGGLVQVLAPGTYYQNAALVIGSNTRLVLSPGVTFKQLDESDDNLLVTDAYAQAWTAVTLSWSSGTEVTVTWTAHGMSEGDYVWLDNSSTASAEQSKFKGVFGVATAADANTLTVHVDRLPSTAPTGSWQAKRATVNAHVSGGIWDYNNAGNADSANQQKHAFMVAGTANSSVYGVKIANCLKYGVLTCASRGLRITDVTVTYTSSAASTSDSIKVYGPDYGTVVDGVYGAPHDDCVSVQTKEPAAFLGYMPAFGDCIGTTLRNINSTSATGTVSGAVIYCSTNEYMGGITVDGVHGRYAAQAVRVQPGDNFAAAQLASATIRGVDANSTVTVRVGGGTGTSDFQIGKLGIEECEHNPRALTDTFIDISSIVNAELIRIAGCQSAVGPLTAPTWPTGAAAVFCAMAGTAELLSLTGCEMNAVAANGRFVQLANASSVRRVNVRDCRLLGNQGVNVMATPGQVPDILFDGNDMNLAYGANIAASANVTAVANTLNGATILARQTAGTATLTHGGNKLNGTAALTSGTVTATAW